ncbi:hypothetical protein HUJ04_000394 [Dendroctonus ponderosae]|nr:hypothetical protein HUJ04_000394 [Dendroctonus ponderosae]
MRVRRYFARVLARKYVNFILLVEKLGYTFQRHLWQIEKMSGNWNTADIDLLITLVRENAEIYDQRRPEFRIYTHALETTWKKMKQQFPFITDDQGPTALIFSSGQELRMQDPPPEHYSYQETPQPSDTFQKRKKVKGLEMDETFMSYLQAKKARLTKNDAESTKSSNELFLLSLLEDMNNFAKAKVRQFERSVLDTLNTLLDDDE